MPLFFLFPPPTHTHTHTHTQLTDFLYGVENSPCTVFLAFVSIRLVAADDLLQRQKQ